MKKNIYFDKNALKEFRAFKKEVQKEFQVFLEVLKSEGKLEFPEAKKIRKNLFEIRLRSNGAYRGFYAYVWKEHIVILHFFQKKTRKTPIKNIKTAKERLRKYE